MQNNKLTPILILLLAAMLFSLFTVFIYGKGDLSVSAKAAGLYVPDTNSFLYEKNIDLALPMASTTKIMTAIIALEQADLMNTITVPKESCGVEGSSIYLKEGDKITVNDLFYSVLLQSANDAAETLAYHISGDVASFAELMNEKAYELGLENSSFQNPHGLDCDNHYTTVKDLARLAAYALSNENFKKICSTYKYTISVSDTPRVIVNHNKLLKLYDNAIGIKTGYTKKCGRCLVGAAEKNGLRLISVTLDAPDDWNDHKNMLDFGFSQLKAESIFAYMKDQYIINTVGSSKESLKVVPKADKNFIIINKEEKLSSTIELPRYVAAPVKKGDVIGRVKIFKNGLYYKSIDLIADEDLTFNRKGKSGLFS